jgi:hypothetical protein
MDVAAGLVQGGTQLGNFTFGMASVSKRGFGLVAKFSHQKETCWLSDEAGDRARSTCQAREINHAAFGRVAVWWSLGYGRLTVLSRLKKAEAERGLAFFSPLLLRSTPTRIHRIFKFILSGFDTKRKYGSAF